MTRADILEFMRSNSSCRKIGKRKLRVDCRAGEGIILQVFDLAGGDGSGPAQAAANRAAWAETIAFLRASLGFDSKTDAPAAIGARG